MSRTSEYEKLLVDLKTELPYIQYKILEALLQAPRGSNRRGLIRAVFGEEPQTNLGNDTRDRKIRKGIESLRNRGIPIVSTSGRAGYKLDTNPKNIECMIKEWESRITHLQQRADAARGYYDLFVEIFQAKRSDP
jgi:DNA-binding winged helix-turn-helix (wHTH) protein